MDIRRHYVVAAAVSFSVLALSACGSTSELVAVDPAAMDTNSDIPGEGIEVPVESTPFDSVAATTPPTTAATEDPLEAAVVPTATVSDLPEPTESTAPDTTVPGTTIPVETTVPETTVPETTVPETTVPETTVPVETTAVETTVPTTPANITLVDLGDDAAKLDSIDPSEQDGWRELIADSLAVESVEVPSIDGLDMFNSGWKLDDGRFLVRGRWSGDPKLSTWSQHNPAAFPEGDVPERSEGMITPVRLFLVDSEQSNITALSPIPPVRPYQTAVSVGETADVVLEVVLLPGDTVAFTSGFSGAAYDIPYAAFTASIPAI